jgi:hypothetical protein
VAAISGGRSGQRCRVEAGQGCGGQSRPSGSWGHWGTRALGSAGLWGHWWRSGEAAAGHSGQQHGAGAVLKEQ